MKARTIFKIIALAGIPVTGYLSARGAGIKAKKIKEKGEPVTAKEKAIDHISSYWPAYLAGLVSAGSVVLCDSLAGKEIAAATAIATAAVAKKDVIKGQFESYRGLVKEDAGAEKDIEYMSKLANIELDDEGEVLHKFKIFWMDDPITFQATMANVQRALNRINEELIDYNTGCGVVTVSQFLDFVKHPELKTSKTDRAGWSYDLLTVDCDCYYLNFYVYPEGQAIFSHGDENTDTFVVDVCWGPYPELAKSIKNAERDGII